MAEISARCQECGEPMPNWREARGPCEKCGGTVLIHAVVAEVMATPVASFGVELSAERGVTAADRVAELRRSLAEIRTPAESPPSTDAARRRLHDVYSNLWALKEACEREGVATPTVKAAILADAQIARAMDLGNAAKHGTPLGRPWSGEQPVFVRFKSSLPVGGAEWTTDEVVSFAGHEYSGIDIAAGALAAWETLMRGWGLLP